MSTNRHAILAPAMIITTIVCAAAGVCWGVLTYQFLKSDFMEHSAEAAEAQITVTNGFVSTYSEIISTNNFGGGALVPAAFRAKSFERFNNDSYGKKQLHTQLVGLPSNWIETPPSDERMIETIERLVASNESDQISQVFKSGDETIFRAVKPSFATSQSCVDCHNKIQVVQRNWKIGDMMGAYVIDTEITEHLKDFLMLAVAAGVSIGTILLLATTLFRQRHAMASQAEQYIKQSETDPLTGCINRQALIDRARALHKAKPSTSAVLLLDLDHFKNINDTHGLEAGDAILVEYTKLIAECVRSHDLLARLSGEEFGVYVHNTTESIANTIASRICEKVAAHDFTFNSTKIDVTVSIGVTMTNSDKNFNFDDWLYSAGKSVDKAKQEGRNRVIFSPAMA